LAAGAAPTANHAAEIKNCPPPQDIKQLQCFLGMVNFYLHFLPNCAQVLKPLTNLLRGGGAKYWSGPLPPRRPSRMLNVSWRRRCPSNTLPPMLNFLWPLMPPILISEGSCSKNLETIGGHLDSFPTNSQARNHVIQPLTANYWPLKQQSNISVIYAKVELSNFGQIIKPLVTAISRISALISPRQQCHLAFIWEFNVQLLYLPGLKNVVAFCPTQSNNPLDQSLPRRRRIQWILKR
jgi:hypothetical protein